MRRPLLTAAMIVCDEERYLPDCLASMEGIVDEVVVVDTGSTDSSVSIAQDHGARVIRHQWQNSFSEARNVGLDHVRGEWILCIDADERLRPIERSLVVDMLENATEIGFCVHLHQLRGFTATLDWRLWRSDPRVRFRNAMHEKVIFDLEAVAAAEGKELGVSELTLDHVGFEENQERKYERNLPMLRRQVELEPDNIFDWRHLAQVLAATGRLEEAERAWDHAVEIARRIWDEHGGTAWTDLVTLRYARGDDVTELLAEGRARWPRNWALLFAEAQIDLDAGRFESAVQNFRRLLEVDLERLPLDGVGYDERIFGSAAHAGMGAAYFRMGRYADAADAYAAAERVEPDAAEHRVKRQVAASRAAARSGVKLT